MDSYNEPDVPSVAPEDLISTPAAHIGICIGVLSPALSTGDPISPSPAGTLKSSKGSVDACVDEGGINPMYPTPSLVHFVLGNFAFATFLISLIISIVFFAVTWLTVLRDAQSMKDQVLSDATGVSLSPCLNECPLLTVVVAVGINTRP